ncbi:MAG: 3-hydroxybutyryl-CoA dehydrogenase, partial [Clostridiales bacterium]|nr:3-hydroxybutyryl-CoA dehydrogenase [Clostridiales bacterium]
ARIDAGLARQVAKGKMAAEDKDALLGRIAITTSIDALAESDLVIEAVIEDFELKKAVFAELGKVCKPEAIFATNTSSISVTHLASSSGRADKFLGIHFFNPVHVMKLVEIIGSELTDPAIPGIAQEFVLSLGKTPVQVLKDSPGFIVNRLLVPYLNEAVRLLEEGVASIEDIDKAVKLGLNYPMGPFEMIDMGGLDLTIGTLEYFAKEFNDLGYAPRPTLRLKARAGKLGRKTGEGFIKHK